MHTVRRNKKIFDYLEKQIKRLDWNIPVSGLFHLYVFQNLSVADSKEVANIAEDIEPTILDNEAVLFETLKLIGLMEVSTTVDELRGLTIRRKEIKYGNKELTDFDKILKAIMTVPKPKDEDLK